MSAVASQFLSEPVAPPKLAIPTSSQTVEVRIIDTKVQPEFNIPVTAFYSPPTPGFTKLAGPVFAFLVSHGDRHVLFDGGVRRDWENLSPAVTKILSSSIILPRLDHDATSIIDSDTSGLGVRSTNIEALIWSHTHFDHTGDPSRFPASTNLVVGPGVKDMIATGYPTNEDAVTLDTDVAGRNVVEIDFSQDLKVAGFSAHDYFADGSFYLLDAPGHSQGHMCGLARTTYDTASGKSTFVFLGADACHHPGILRPTEYLPLPSSIIPSPFPSQRASGAACSGHAIHQILAHDQPDKPVFELVEGPMFPDIVAAKETLRKMQELDAVGDVFILLVHDASLTGEVTMFPGTVNDWFLKGWRDITRWRFFEDCESVVLK
ncbi:Cytochrome P450 monooxygenase andK [Paramyrothecium foliicola]|nr:Cytochrome P450 monooxygenase andK [Paramyrothecium foliicola]